MKVVVLLRGTQEWREAHRNKVTASDAQSLLARSGTDRRNELINRLVLDAEGHGLHTDEHPDPWVEQHERDLVEARQAYVKWSGTAVSEVGLVTHDQFDRLGASPHGLIGDRGLLHLRVRHTMRSFREKTKLSRAERARLQLTMFVCDRAWCEVADFWSGAGQVPDKLQAQRLDFDEGWMLETVFPRLLALWKEVRDAVHARTRV